MRMAASKDACASDAEKLDDSYLKYSTFAEDQASSSQNDQNQSSSKDSGESVESENVYDVKKELREFWPRIKAKINSLEPATLREASRHQELPLARIKKIMKLDDDVKQQMISAEAPVLLAKACELFIEELTLYAWSNTEENKRKTLQKSDISQAVGANDQFDFLIDIVPRDETRRSHNRSHASSSSIPVVTDSEATILTAPPNGENANFQYVLQLGPAEGTLSTGSVVQATQIGQPIQLPATSEGQPIQLIALNLPDGNVQQFQVQLPASNISSKLHVTTASKLSGSGREWKRGK